MNRARPLSRELEIGATNATNVQRIDSRSVRNEIGV